MKNQNLKSPQYACAAWGWRELEVPDYFNHATQLGFTALEVNAHSQTPKHLLNNLSEEAVEKVRFWAEDGSVEIACVAADNDFTVTNAADLEAEIRKVCRCVDIAKKLQTKLIRVFAGGENQDCLSPEILQQLHTAFNCVGNYAETHGITIAIENHGGLTATGQRIAKIMEGINSAAVGVNYDPANFLMAGSDPLMALRYILPWVKYTHWKDVRWGNGKPELCAVGEGEIRWTPIVKELLNADYQGYWVIEYEGVEDIQRGTKDSLAYLERVFQEVI